MQVTGKFVYMSCSIEILEFYVGDCYIFVRCLLSSIQMMEFYVGDCYILGDIQY